MGKLSIQFHAEREASQLLPKLKTLTLIMLAIYHGGVSHRTKNCHNPSKPPSFRPGSNPSNVFPTRMEILWGIGYSCHLRLEINITGNCLRFWVKKTHVDLAHNCPLPIHSIFHALSCFADLMQKNMGTLEAISQRWWSPKMHGAWILEPWFHLNFMWARNKLLLDYIYTHMYICLHTHRYMCLCMHLYVNDLL